MHLEALCSNMDKAVLPCGHPPPLPPHQKKLAIAKVAIEKAQSLVFEVITLTVQYGTAQVMSPYSVPSID
ncbi:hypothetical protein BHE90_008172 [Fusarium euwallaceae]|uniref:Uncharacterized protein n=1 Tax=Fusarium euwallaceae TaxID=1147111 RepID=A0A430LNP8_9HYPO|nr:hypothetical protein BHE90_008172 [Fusarium euwallaceae]